MLLHYAFTIMIDGNIKSITFDCEIKNELNDEPKD
jgi:hypothetical protein